MVRGNHVITKQHFHKDWQNYIKTWFKQPLRKVRKFKLRNQKIKQKSPRPLNRLQPVVNCPSNRYNQKFRLGRGFSLLELKKAGLHPKFARSVGISVDIRRINKISLNDNNDTLKRNVQRLKEYMSKLVLEPKGKKKDQKENKAQVVYKTQTNYVMPLKKTKVKGFKQQVKARKVTEKEKKYSAYVDLRKRYHAKRKKNAKKMQKVFD